MEGFPFLILKRAVSPMCFLQLYEVEIWYVGAVFFEYVFSGFQLIKIIASLYSPRNVVFGRVFLFEFCSLHNSPLN